MAVPNLDEINTLARKKILPGLADAFFKADPLLAYLKRNRYFTWTGGPQIQTNYIYAPLKGGAYSPGDTFDITKRQTKSGLLFDPKFYQVNITEISEQVEVLVGRGSEAVMSMVQADMGVAALTMSGLLANALYRHGQNIGGNDRTKQLNGLEEALTDGVNATYSVAAPGFLNFGTQARGVVAPALNSPLGLINSPNVNGAITYRVLEHSYQSCVIGEEHPRLGVTTNRCMGFLNENFQPQQRIDVVEPTIGYTGLKFKAATIVESQYCPGQDITQLDVDNLGAVIPTTVGETFWWLNPGPEGDNAYLKLYFASSPKYQFGFTGFKVQADSTQVAGQILFGGNLIVPGGAQRYMRCLYGIIR